MDNDLEGLAGVVADLTAERDRLLARQDAIAAALDQDDGLRVDELRALARERAENADVLAAIGPRLDAAHADLKAAQTAERAARARALRPAERDRFLAVVGAADELHAAIAALDQVYHDLVMVGAAPLTVVPRDLAAWVRPGPHGGRDQWVRTVDRIDATL